MVTRGSGEIDWYSYDLPSRIDDLSDSSYTEFWYGPDRSRIKQYQSASGATITYAGTLFEFEDASTDTYRHYVQAGDKVIAVVERVGTTNTKQFLHRDHQGSVVKVTNASGTVDQALAFDAWGLRRNASDWSALGSPFAGSHETERGYTGHEHLDTVGLIHMNGRVQDPILGRFISADPLIQAPYQTQSHNRYSYFWNNPASLIDPSGFCTAEDGWTDCEGDTVTVTAQCETAACRDAVRQRDYMPQHVADSVARWMLRRERAEADRSTENRGGWDGIDRGLVWDSLRGMTANDWRDSARIAVQGARDHSLGGQIFTDYLSPVGPLIESGAACSEGSRTACAMLGITAITRKGGSAAKGSISATIREIKALPDGATLTANQISALSRNIDALLSNSLPGKVASGRVQDLVSVFRTDPRFRFLDQVPGARERIEGALRAIGATLE